MPGRVVSSHICRLRMIHADMLQIKFRRESAKPCLVFKHMHGDTLLLCSTCLLVVHCTNKNYKSSTTKDKQIQLCPGFSQIFPEHKTHTESDFGPSKIPNRDPFPVIHNSPMPVRERECSLALSGK